MDSNFQKNIKSIYKDYGEKWLVDLPQLVSDLTSKLNLRDLKPVNNLSFNYVLKGFQKYSSIILKTVLDYPNLKRESHALNCFDGVGINLLDGGEGWLLLQRAIPGATLKNDPTSTKILEIICSIITKLHQTSIPQTHDFP
jgi:streptomycin 6-kinase